MTHNISNDDTTVTLYSPGEWASVGLQITTRIVKSRNNYHYTTIDLDKEQAKELIKRLVGYL